MMSAPSEIGRYCCKSPQKALRLIFRQRTKRAKVTDQRSLKPVAGIACEFGARRRGSPTLLFGRRAYGSENLRPLPQKDFCNTIGTKRTYRARSVMSAFNFRLDFVVMENRLHWQLLLGEGN
jgi:hypothetical protein